MPCQTPCSTIVGGKPCDCGGGGGGGDLTGITSADGSIAIVDATGPVPDLSVRRAYGECFLGIGAMGNLPEGVWFQAPLPTAGPLNNVAHVAGADLVPAASADYVLHWGMAATYIADPANATLSVILTLNGQPGGGGTLIDGTEALWELNPSKRVLTMARTAIFPIAAGDAVGMWILLSAGPAMAADSINLNMGISLA